MARSPAGPSARRTVWLAGITFLLTFTAVAGFAATWARSSAQPRIILLGSGSAVSVLVTAGSSRLLIATGDNTTDFGNALDAALPPTIRRLDVLLVPSGSQDDAVAAHALRTRHARYRALIGPRGMSTGDIPGELEMGALTAPRRFQLPEGVSVTVDFGPEVARAGRSGQIAWRATIAHGATTVVVVATGADVGGMLPSGAVSAVVIVRGQPDGTLANAEIHALIVNEEVAKKTGWREDLARAGPSELGVLPVADGEVQILRLVDGGLQVPPDVQPLPTYAPSSAET